MSASGAITAVMWLLGVGMLARAFLSRNLDEFRRERCKAIGYFAIVMVFMHEASGPYSTALRVCGWICAVLTIVRAFAAVERLTKLRKAETCDDRLDGLLGVTYYCARDRGHRGAHSTDSKPTGASLTWRHVRRIPTT